MGRYLDKEGLKLVWNAIDTRVKSNASAINTLDLKSGKKKVLISSNTAASFELKSAVTEKITISAVTEYYSGETGVIDASNLTATVAGSSATLTVAGDKTNATLNVALPTTAGQSKAVVGALKAPNTNINATKTFTARTRVYAMFGDTALTTMGNIINGTTSNTTYASYLGEPNKSTTVSVPVITTGEEFKYVYIYVPSYITKFSVTQPESLGAPLAFTQQATNATGQLANVTQSWKVYKSDIKITSRAVKKLTISI